MLSSPHCRFCHAPLRATLVDLGTTPLANSYVPPEKLGTKDPVFPLHARVCSNCRLVQVDDVATPDNIFSHYAYFSSFSQSWVEHAKCFAEMAKDRWKLGSNSLVVEIASNDGYLLQHFVKMGVPVLGVEPAANVAEVAVKNGVRTEVAFFGKEAAQRLKAEGYAADLMAANNVFAHVPDINDFIGGFAILLKPDGVISLEFPHLLRLIADTQFDTIYHEHFSYLSLYAVEKILAAAGLKVFDVTELPTHGGSLRVMATHQASTAHAAGAGLTKVRGDEAAIGIDTDAYYSNFEPKVRAVRTGLLEFLRKAKADGKKVAAYGAAAKGNTLLNYCGIDTDLIDYVVDISPYKQGTYLPGSRLPIYAPSKIAETKPDYVLILPWNIKDEITAQMTEVRAQGGRFVIAIPALTILP
ncbi:MAG TPA: class I SAM-dependent methyltransferase [Pseudolabrys sp.]